MQFNYPAIIERLANHTNLVGLNEWERDFIENLYPKRYGKITEPMKEKILEINRKALGRKDGK